MERLKELEFLAPAGSFLASPTYLFPLLTEIPPPVCPHPLFVPTLFLKVRTAEKISWGGGPGPRGGDDLHNTVSPPQLETLRTVGLPPHPYSIVCPVCSFPRLFIQHNTKNSCRQNHSMWKKTVLWFLCFGKKNLRLGMTVMIGLCQNQKLNHPAKAYSRLQVWFYEFLLPLETWGLCDFLPTTTLCMHELTLQISASYMF